ncbi:MAG: putative cytosolic protein exonuclease [Deltaproteobacteria bacterium]|nr:putative cytosolic protein exonuclease [Deltaproteobacteria bacterium]
MSLKDRLSRLVGETPKPGEAKADPRQDKINELRARIDTIMSRRERIIPSNTPKARRNAVPLGAAVAGEEVHTPHGKFFMSRTTLNADDVYGCRRVCDFACPSMPAAAFLTGRQDFTHMSITDGLFLDTETTGLSGGTGTFPFLIGLGWFEEDSFITCQLFARDFSEEGAVLRYLSELASGKQFLVTFNGKAYDINLLTTRFILNRSHDRLAGMPHIDLLHPSRRIFAHRLENARLSTIESDILGVTRVGDVPGFEIPQRYFDWLRQQDGMFLKDVFEHNRLDIVSMASLLKHLTDLVENSIEMENFHHGDLLKLALFLHERGDAERSLRMLESLITSPLPDVATGARRSLSIIYKKMRRWDDAVKLWLELAEADRHDIFAIEELAKFYEHHTREFEKALEIVSGLLGQSSHLDNVNCMSLEYRHKRLLHKTSPKTK